MPFEDELGEALRSAGAGFTTDSNALVEAGERRGRRLVARRRAAVVGGSALALALVGGAGAWSTGLLGPGSGGDVAAPPRLPKSGSADGPPSSAGTGAVSAGRLGDILRELVAPANLISSEGRGTGDEPGPYVRGVIDDGKGRGSIGVSLTRIDPVGAMAKEMTTCPDRKVVKHVDSCVEEKLPDGSRLLLVQSYVYDDERKDAKNWRATLATPEGFLVDASEVNAPTEKDSRVSRPDPVLTMARMKALALSDKWRPALEDLPAARPETKPGDTGPGSKAVVAKDALEHLLRRYEIPPVGRGGEGGYGYVLLDDGNGESLIELRIMDQTDSSGFAAGATSQPGGVRMKVSQGPVDNGGAVVRWTVDTLRSDGKRVTVSAYNAPKQSGTPSRTAPVLTVEQLKEIALSDNWKELWGR
ncbi:hypothetical protein ABZZ17_03045 [Streptomyces sp. NPDC006512]|uniref:hypothetical protein n=1 Tax=Streptomyces sp. NPDC006512 TaxID=3154307 RepID=UPI0033A48B5E